MSAPQPITDHPALSRMTAAVPPPVQRVVRTLSHAGHSAVVVGGAVRDLVLELPPSDFDVATSATPDEVMALFAHTVPTGVQHGTVTVVERSDDGHPVPVEVTTFRTEGGYRDGRRPDSVSFVRELDDDLSRRDFTVNAIALHLWPVPALSDPFHGIDDLRAGVLRTVGSADVRFQEDGLRAVRAARFLAQLGLAAADGLEDAMRRALPVVRRVAAERFLQELRKLFEKAKQPSAGLALLARTGLLAHLAPHAPHDDVSFRRTDRVTARFPEARFAAWLWAAGEKPARATLVGLKASRTLQDDVAALCALPRPDALSSAPAAELRRVVRRVGRRRLGPAMALWDAEDGRPLMERVETVLSQGFVELPTELALDGDRLQALVGAHGRALGELLRALMDKVDEDPACNTEDGLARLARKLHPPAT